MKKSILFFTNLLVFAFFTSAQFQNGNRPMFSDTLLFEDWSSGSFDTNQWIVYATYPWALRVIDYYGYPPPTADFTLYEFITCTLTSKEITGTNKYTELRYDINVFPDEYYLTYSFRAEIYDGNIWHTIDIVEGWDYLPWETRVVNISPYCQNNFKIRFFSVGQDTPLGHLYIDNIIVGSFPLGIAENQNSDFIIKPNPAKSNFDIVLKNFENQNTQIVISDLTGKVVYSEEFIPGTKESTTRISTDHFSRGIYFCVIKSDKINLIRKLILD